MIIKGGFPCYGEEPLFYAKINIDFLKRMYLN